MENHWNQRSDIQTILAPETRALFYEFDLACAKTDQLNIAEATAQHFLGKTNPLKAWEQKLEACRGASTWYMQLQPQGNQRRKRFHSGRAKRRCIPSRDYVLHCSPKLKPESMCN